MFWSALHSAVISNSDDSKNNLPLSEVKEDGISKAPVGGPFTWVSTISGLPIISLFAYRAEPRNCPACSCGTNSSTTSNDDLSNISDLRIYGGKNATDGMYPWMVALYYDNKFICGGSLINNLYILTAASCVFNTDRTLFSVKFLMYDRGNPDSNFFERRVSYIMTNWFLDTGITSMNDLALLKLNETVPLGSGLSPVCLPPEGPTYGGYNGTVTGWGNTVNYTYSRVLQEATVPILTYDECLKQSNYHFFQIDDSKLCAGAPDGGIDACQGDTGGPLHIIDQQTGKYVIAGVVSVRTECAQPKYPGIYTRVNKFRSWIKFNTRDACYCSS
ncbi:serine protease hepsin-like [Sabethes cyaneus]|uniref:serine protease hepsin-like n=1 Tax=Sabethes cyaneus TaxID=53552 RepID=UPI00237E7191|nr:serine protease hepsin-like [Sabethes cyaneus]